MAGGKGTTFANNVLTWALTAGAVTRPTSWTVALYTDATGLSTPPTTEATTNCPGYARQNVTFNAPSSGSTTNSNDVAFTATGAWATVNYGAVIDNNGVMIDWFPLSASRTLQVSGDKIDFAIGQITIGEK